MDTAWTQLYSESIWREWFKGGGGEVDTYIYMIHVSWDQYALLLALLVPPPSSIIPVSILVKRLYMAGGYMT